MVARFRFVAWSVIVLCVALPARAGETEPVRPTDVIPLFNGKNLDGFYTWMKDTQYEDPRTVFSVKDGMLHVSGDGLGGLITKQAYRDYHLVIEFKWGEKTWGARQDRTRDSGILVHCTGPDGGYN
ncbi:MAG: 3-keto-disaccharide hydrolase, partial [Planctomycetaceae bacterium]